MGLGKRFAKWLSRKGNFGGTARTIGNQYRIMRDGDPQAPRQQILRQIVDFRHAIIPYSSEQKRRLYNAAAYAGTLTDFVMEVVLAEDNTYERELGNMGPLSREVVREELKKLGLDRPKGETEVRVREAASEPAPPLAEDHLTKHPFWNEHGVLLRDATAVRDAIFQVAQRLMEEDNSGAVTADTEREIRGLVKEADRLRDLSKGQRELPPDIIASAKVTPSLQAAWTKGMDTLTESVQLWGQYARALAKMATASREGNVDAWNKLIGETNVLAYKGPNKGGEALALLDDFHKQFREHMVRSFGYDPAATP